MLTLFSFLIIITFLSALHYKNHSKLTIKAIIIPLLATFLLAACTNNDLPDMSQNDSSSSQASSINDNHHAEDEVNENEEANDADENAEDNNQEVNEADEPEEKTETKEEIEELSDLKAHFIDVGQADAALIEAGDFKILIDSGDWLGNETIDYLNAQGISQIDLIMGSHPHADHIGQIDKIIEQFEVDEVWMSGDTTSSKVFERVMTAIDSYGIGYDEPRAGDHYEIGDMIVDIFSPSSLNGNLNDDSIVLKLTYGAVSFLFTGDAEKNAETEMLNRDHPLDSTILKVGHHGSNTSSTPAFIDAVQPEVAIISVAEKSKYSHPDQSVLDTLKSHDVDLYATKAHGNIIVTTDGQTYDIETTRSGEISAGLKKEKKKQSKPKKAASKKQADPAAQSANDNCIDINSASEADLQNIIHIGPARAIDLIDLRPFSSVDDLVRIKGIAAKRLEDIKAQGLACAK